MGAIFRPASRESSDRSAGDRLRHRQKVRRSIMDNIGDIVADESIIGRSGDQVVKVPIRGIKEYRFVHGENHQSVGEGASDDLAEGDVIARKPDSTEENRDRQAKSPA